MNTGLVLFVAIAAGSLCVGEAIKCYSCFFTTVSSSVSNPNCDEGKAFSNANTTGSSMTIVDCTGKCYKARAAISSSRTITRGCLGTCVQGLVGGNGNACCDTDYCNAAWRMTAASSSVVLLLSLVVAAAAASIRG